MSYMSGDSETAVLEMRRKRICGGKGVEERRGEEGGGRWQKGEKGCVVNPGAEEDGGRGAEQGTVCRRGTGEGGVGGRGERREDASGEEDGDVGESMR